MRNISFMLTKEQIRNRTKTVTRRIGWKNLKPGTLLQGCEKCQGLKPGEKLKKLAVVRVVRVTRERLWEICALLDYGVQEVVREGFPDMSPEQFVKMFCEHMECTVNQIVTRIEFEYVD